MKFSKEVKKGQRNECADYSQEFSITAILDQSQHFAHFTSISLAKKCIKKEPYLNKTLGFFDHGDTE